MSLFPQEVRFGPSLCDLCGDMHPSGWDCQADKARRDAQMRRDMARASKLARHHGDHVWRVTFQTPFFAKPVESWVIIGKHQGLEAACRAAVEDAVEQGGVKRRDLVVQSIDDRGIETSGLVRFGRRWS